MLSKRTRTVYVLLGAIWILFLLWQLADHARVKRSAHESLLTRARDIANSVSVVIRSQGRFGMVSERRLEAALQELAESSELQSMAFLNAAGEVVASAGQRMELGLDDLPDSGERWARNSVTIVNLVDLGGRVRDRATTRPATIIIRPSESRPPQPPGEEMPAPPQESGDEPRPEPRRGFGQPPPPPDDNAFTTGPISTSRKSFNRMRDLHRRRSGRWGRPPWMNEKEYEELLEKQGLHGFVMQMSTKAYRSEITRDFWLRLTLLLISTVAALGLGIAWRNVERTQRLQMRLLRAGEMNVHLKEMNIAAAGLAHETRNPLNIVRGQAQIISRDPGVSDEVREKAGDIMMEVDRVTSRLTEFINYSKPLSPRPSPTSLLSVANDVKRTLTSDIEDKSLNMEIAGPDITIEADESMLRQVIFNLLLNAIQAVDPGGTVTVNLQSVSPREACLDVIDDGPGVPVDAREDIFRPYYTTREGGTGFGLAVVRQIVLAHHWEIEYLPAEKKGSIFRISGLKIIS